MENEIMTGMESMTDNNAMLQELAELKRELEVQRISAKVLSLGLAGDVQTADLIADCLVDLRDVEGAITLIGLHFDRREAELRKELAAARRSGSMVSTGTTRAELGAMDYRERLKFYNEHRGEYEKLMGRG